MLGKQRRVVVVVVSLRVQKFKKYLTLDQKRWSELFENGTKTEKLEHQVFVVFDVI